MTKVVAGGRNADYLPDASDSSIFDALGSGYFEQFMRNCSLLPDNKWDQMTTFFTDITNNTRAYKNKHTIHRNSIKAMETQARPYEYRGNVILVFLGEEPSKDHLKNWKHIL